MERTALQDVGLKPWEFESMTLQQYVDYAEGVRIREAKSQEPLRLIYWVLRAANSKKPVSYHDICQQWPLHTDKRKRQLPAQEMRSRWNNLKALQQVVNDAGRVQDNNEQ